MQTRKEKLQFPNYVRCKDTFNATLARLQEKVEKSSEKSIQDLHVDWQREQRGLPLISEKVLKDAKKFHVSVSHERHMRAQISLRKLWKMHDQFYRTRETKGWTGVLERLSGTFEHGDTPFENWKIKFDDGTTEHISIEAGTSVSSGQRVTGDYYDGFFIPNKQSLGSNYRPRKPIYIPETAYEVFSSHSEPPRDDRPFKPWKGRGWSYTHQ